jgi:hypothetical protein
MIDFQWWMHSLLWFGFGAASMLLAMLALAPVILSSQITVWEEEQAERVESERVRAAEQAAQAAMVAQLEAEEKAEFYYAMVASQRNG